MDRSWSSQAIRQLLDRSSCPRCGSRKLEGGWCRNCHANLNDPIAQQVWESSIALTQAIQARDALIATLPTSATAPALGVVAAAVAAPAVPATASAPPPPTGAPIVDATAAAVSPTPAAAPASAAATSAVRSSVTVQSVLAVAGAALFAVAAIVFTFFNPDIDFGARSAIIGIVTVLFLGGAWLFASRGLRFSAEAVGALGMVFLALDVWAFSDGSPDEVSEWIFAAIGTLVASVLMIVIAAIVRLRVWLLISLVGLVLVPAFVGYSFDDPWASAIGHIVAAFVALGTHELIRRLRGRFGSELRADRMTVSILQIVIVASIVLFQTFALPQPTGVTPWALGIAGIFAALTLLTLLSTRNEFEAFWSVAAGGFGVAAIATLPLALDVQPSEWNFATIPGAAAIAFVATAAIRRSGPIHAVPWRAGALSVTLAVAVPAIVLSAVRIPFVALSARASGNTDVWFDVEPTLWLAGMAGVAALAVAVWAASRLQSGAFAAAMAVLARWLGGLALLNAAAWPGLPPIALVSLELGLALLVSATLIFVPRARESRLALRVPLVLASFTALALAIAVSWDSTELAVIGGAAALGVLVAIAYTLPLAARPVLMGVGFAYSLLLFSTALTLTDLETLTILCLTATFGSVVALVATLTPWLRPATWYAVLIVTVIPFVIAVAVLFVDIRGWTALSTGVFFLLALALVVTRRAGLTLVIRAAAAALLVPSLAVVVISLGAQFIEVSASPITLPIIAIIVAAVLPTTGLMAAALVRNGLTEKQAATVRFWIELSSLVTAAIAVLLALVRPAAGLGTALQVFVILGIGAVASAIWGGRRSGWIIGAVAWTGALWTALVLNDVELTVIEPYALPPAIVAALVGAFLVARGHRAATGLYATGLAAAVVPSLVVLAFWGSGPDAGVPWRALGLLAASALLVVVGVLVRGRAASDKHRFAALRVPTLIVAIAAAAAGSVQGARYGWEVDALPSSFDPAALMAVVLVLGVVAAALATAAGVVAVTGAGAAAPPRRWWFLAAVAYLVFGPMTAGRPEAFETWTLWTLMALVLGLMVVTTRLARRGAVALPPVWYLFAIAWITGVVGWSQREYLRLEWWSIPMGVALTAAGVIALLARSETRRSSFNAWPIGFRGSWVLLGPGLIVLMLPSMIATFTDPSTWRAILVIAFALVSVLAGAVLKLRAPFILGLIVLPLENAIVFAVQIGQGVESVPWWITLATAGAVLLAIAIRAERRTGSGSGDGARLRDLE